MEKEDAGEEGVKGRELGPEEMIDLILAFTWTRLTVLRTRSWRFYST